ncbi:S-methyl-5-thioribose-1-phosphate isomerase [Rhodohalobacter sp. 8-1]|uniref:S-methyl-5-thioribose-1-phosphate isomerase n=1 Tax=Rhodohalobacter sp. 8-1 TaxID=3131972 RepID=UPI0030EDE105
MKDELYQSIEWRDGGLYIIDQTQLPAEELIIQLETAEQVWEAIRQLKVRGAPAIGITGAYGLYLGIRDFEEGSYESFIQESRRLADYLNSSRPTAVNLSWALNHILEKISGQDGSTSLSNLKKLILHTAIAIHDEDRQLCKQIGENGRELVPDGANILTHCNTGGLATGQYGTAFSVIFHAHLQGKVEQVWVDETRPLLQGARLTTWEFQKASVPHSLIVDSAAGFLMSRGKVDMIVTGADRIAKNGDTANKIGTYTLSVLAKEHGIPFYIAAPYSTLDMNIDNGSQIEIELRDEEEVLAFNHQPSTPSGTKAYNPAFDITPHQNISAIITEKGIIYPEFEKNIRERFSVAEV